MNKIFATIAALLALLFAAAFALNLIFAIRSLHAEVDACNDVGGVTVLRGAALRCEQRVKGGHK